MGLVKQVYEYNLQAEATNLTTEKDPSVQTMIDEFRSVLRKSMESLNVAEMILEKHTGAGGSTILAQGTARNLIHGEIRSCYKELSRICDDYSV